MLITSRNLALNMYCYRVDVLNNINVARKDDVLKFGCLRNEIIVMEHEDFFIIVLEYDAQIIFYTDLKMGHLQTNDHVRQYRFSIENNYSKKWQEMKNVDVYDYRATN
ncbi:hypothetical protein RF11_16417 [Thelohanellus kitauei]|uniref:Uncharacterized protein n=1 Tax=Thelohanellus kitauei TaxID=669202 RepID=A0A0C2IXM7_THEKT|nr:hypothetical protein RF11_16417 [Thelohanellus kitauei]